jgi:putative transposase
MTKITYSGYRFPPEIIHQAIWLYLRTLSFRDVEDLLTERGIAISYETIRRWVNHFGPIIAAELRKRRPRPHSIWHLDEVYLKIDGRMVYLWRAVDAEGEVLDVLVQSKRNKHAALKLMRKLLRKYAVVPERLVTDDLRSYGAATLDLAPPRGLRRQHPPRSRLRQFGPLRSPARRRRDRVPQSASIPRVDRIVQAACIEEAAEGRRDALIDEKTSRRSSRAARGWTPNLRVGFAIKKRRLEGFPGNIRIVLREVVDGVAR